eukprot:678735-Rhodomonas_salina.2
MQYRDSEPAKAARAGQIVVPALVLPAYGSCNPLITMIAAYITGHRAYKLAMTAALLEYQARPHSTTVCAKRVAHDQSACRVL